MHVTKRTLSYQVEGAFTQGLGLYTMEQCVYLEGNTRTQRGQLYTTGPGTYKIPTCSDIPVELNVTLMDGTSNPQAIFSSKVTDLIRSLWVEHCVYCSDCVVNLTMYRIQNHKPMNVFLGSGRASSVPGCLSAVCHPRRSGCQSGRQRHHCSLPAGHSSHL